MVQYNYHYSKWSMSNQILSKGGEENKNWSILMSSQDITLLLWAVEIQFQPYSNIFTISRFNCWNYLFFRLILCTWYHFSLSVNIFSFYFTNLFLDNYWSFVQQNLLCYCSSLTFYNCIICNIFQSFNVCPKSAC